MKKMAQLWMVTALFATAAGCSPGTDPSSLGVAASALTITPLADGLMQPVNDKIDLKKGTMWVHTDSVTLQPGDVIPFHHHPAQGALIITEGTVTFQHIDGSRESVSAGQVTYEDPNVEHSVVNCGSVQTTVIGTFFIPCAGVGQCDFVIWDFSRPPATCN